jgi:hypothetical protein
MQPLKQLYRKDYQGEQVTTNLVHQGQDWVKTTEFIPNQIANMQVSNRALILGNGETRLGVNMQLIANHRAGLRGSNRLQTYGCNALYRDYAPDFLINAGGLINVYQEHIGYNRETAYRKAEHIFDVTLEILKVSATEKIHTQKAAMNLAEKRILDMSRVRSTY